jgi:tetratricopeptide (TPR) repeat protein
VNESPEFETKRRVDAYFAASFEVARRLAEGRGQESVEILRRELERIGDSSDITSRRFLLSQIALCHARMNQRGEAEEVLQEIETTFPQDIETALMLAEGYLLLLANAERASHHAAKALQWLEQEGEVGPDLLSRAHTLMARSLLQSHDLLGAFGAWQASPLPDWRVAIEIIEAGHDPERVREVLLESLPRHQQFEAENASTAVAVSDQIRRLLLWIDAGCPKNPQQPV